jgi:hypothetical protein
MYIKILFIVHDEKIYKQAWLENMCIHIKFFIFILKFYFFL